jgi:hypothetical protein
VSGISTSLDPFRRAPAVVDVFDRPAVDQPPHDLLQEERVPSARSRIRSCTDGGRSSTASSSRISRRFLGGEWIERDGRRVAPSAAPARPRGGEIRA